MSTSKKNGKTPDTNTKNVKPKYKKYPPPRGMVLASDNMKAMSVDEITDKVWDFIQEFQKDTKELNKPKQ